MFKSEITRSSILRQRTRRFARPIDREEPIVKAMRYAAAVKGNYDRRGRCQSEIAPWMKLVDISAVDFIGQFSGGETDFNHDDVTLVAFADAHAVILSEDASAVALKAATTRAAADEFNAEDVLP